MTTSTLTLADFLLARIAEEAASAQAIEEGGGDIQRAYFDRLGVSTSDGSFNRVYLTIDPARVLAECDAKRRIVETYQGTQDAFDALDARVTAGKLTGTNAFVQLAVSGALIEAYADILRTLALPYADHEDYDEGWRP